MQNEKMMKSRRYIEIPCDGCGNLHYKAYSEINRNVKVGRKNYCSTKCPVYTAALSAKIKEVRARPNYIDYDISLHSNNKRDEYTGFREFLRRARCHGYSPTVTLEQLKTIWEKQEHKCIYTNIELTLPKTKSTRDIIRTASLDRIDSSRDYEPDNVQFVCTAINYMKSTMSDEQTKELINLIRASS